MTALSYQVLVTTLCQRMMRAGDGFEEVSQLERISKSGDESLASPTAGDEPSVSPSAGFDIESLFN